MENVTLKQLLIIDGHKTIKIYVQNENQSIKIDQMTTNTHGIVYEHEVEHQKIDVLDVKFELYCLEINV